MMLRILLLILTLVLSVTGVAVAQDVASDQQKSSAPLMFRVTGQAEVMPETVQLHFTIVGDGETLAKAQEQLDQAEQKVTQALKKFEIKREQMKTDRFSIMPLQPNLGVSPMNPTSLPAIGYRAQRDYRIQPAGSIESLAKLIQIADAALQQGARPSAISSDQWRGGDAYGGQSGMLLEFAIRDPDSLLKAAVNDAVTRARGLAEGVIKQMSKQNLRMASLRVLDTSRTSQNNYGASVADSTLESSFAWQPVKVIVTAEVGFTCE